MSYINERLVVSLDGGIEDTRLNPMICLPRAKTSRPIVLTSKKSYSQHSDSFPLTPTLSPSNTATAGDPVTAEATQRAAGAAPRRFQFREAPQRESAPRGRQVPPRLAGARRGPMVYINTDGVVVAQRSNWRLSVLVDLFWAVVNFFATFFSSLLPSSRKPSIGSDGRARRNNFGGGSAGGGGGGGGGPRPGGGGPAAGPRGPRNNVRTMKSIGACGPSGT